MHKLFSVAVAIMTVVFVSVAQAGAAPLPRADEGRPGTVTYAGVSVKYFEYGPSAEDAPTVVLSSGWPGSSMFFAQRARDFAARGLHVVRYDQRGAGSSDHPHDPLAYGLPELAREFGAVIDATSAGHAVHVFGSGFSVFAASEYTAITPGRVASITSIGAPSIDLGFESLQRKTLEARTGADPVLSARVAAQWAALSYMFANSDSALSQSAAEVLRPVHALSNSLYAAAADDLRALSAYGADNYPLFATEDTKWGSLKYQWAINNRLDTVGHFLDVPHLRVYQAMEDPGLSDLLVDGLADRTHDLVYVPVPGTRLSAVVDGPIGQQMVDGVIDTINRSG